MSGEIIVILFQTRIEIFQQRAVAGAVPELEKQINLNRNGRAVQNERVVRIARIGGVRVQVFDRPERVDLHQSEPDESGIPGVKRIPAASGRMVTHEPSLHICRVDHIRKHDRAHALLTERHGRFRNPEIAVPRRAAELRSTLKRERQTLRKLRLRTVRDNRVNGSRRPRLHADRLKEDVEMAILSAPVAPCSEMRHVDAVLVKQNAVEIIDRVPPGEGVGEIPADTVRMRQPRIADDPAVRQRSFAEFRTRGKSIAEELRLLIRNGENVDFEFGIRLCKERFTRKILYETVCLKRSLPAELKRSERRPQQSFSLNRRAKPERPVRGKGNLRFFPGFQTIRGAVDHTVHAHFSGLQTVEDESVSGEKVRFRVRHIAVQRLPVRHEGGEEVEREIGIELRMIDALAGDETGMGVDFRE